MELIDKDALVAEIEKRLKEHVEQFEKNNVISSGIKAEEDLDIISFLDTIKVKEVDFEREMSKYVSNGIHRFFPKVDDDYCRMDSVIWQGYVIETAKHFFELGLSANNNSVIEKACEWLKNNVTYTHPRTSETKCVVNLNAFIDAMKGEMNMCFYKKKVKPLNTFILQKYRQEALGRLKFIGSWSGFWETSIDGVRYRSETVSGLKYVVGDCGSFIQDAIIDRVKLRRDPKKYSLDKTERYITTNEES